MDNRTGSSDYDNNSTPITSWDSLIDQEKKIEGKTFYEDKTKTKESEFKRITGEDWPGVDYAAEIDEANDDGCDESVVYYRIRKLTEEEKKAKFAEYDLDIENAKSTLIKRIWKGNLFKKYYQKNNEKQFLEGERKVGVDGEELNLDKVTEKRRADAIKRFVLGATEDMRFVHQQIDKKYKNSDYQKGEKLDDADVKTTQTVKEAIEFFATAKIPEDGNLKDLKREFSNRIERLEAENRDQKNPTRKELINNYFEIAIQARQRAEHDIAIEKVMEGFKAYNADARNSIRTEAHRDNIDKIIARYT